MARDPGSLRTLGFAEDELTEGGSDRLVDSLVCWGSVETVANKVMRYLDAGADHVCVQVLSDEPDQFPIRQYRELSLAIL